MNQRGIWKMLVLLLVLILSVSVLTACGDDDDDDDDDRKSSSESDGKGKKGDKNSTISDPGGKIDVGDPDKASLTTGEYLYKAIPDSNLNKIKDTAPYSVNVVIYRDDGGRNVNMTSKEAAVAKVAKAVSNIKVGNYVGTTKESKLNSITFRWANGSETELLFYGTKLAYKTDWETEVYEMEGGTELWAAATNLNSSDPADDYDDAVCTEQNFKTKVQKGCPTMFEEGPGLYIGTSPDYGASVIPYVMVKRWGNVGVAAKDYLTQVTTKDFRGTYGDNLLKISEQEEFDAELADGSRKKMYGMSFRYDAAGNSLWMYRVVGEFDGEIVTFTAKYIDGEDWSEKMAMDALELAIVYFQLTDKQAKASTPTPTQGGSKFPGMDKSDFDIRIVESEASKVKFESYDNGLFSCEVSKGWVVNVHPQCDYIHYTFQIYDPNNPDLRIFFNMKTEDYWASKEDHDIFAQYYPDSVTAKMPWVDPQTTEVFYPVMFGYLQDANGFKFRRTTEFKKIESLGRDVLGGEIIHATSVNESGKGVEGVYSCTIVPVSLYYVTGLYVYNTYYLSAPEGELSNWIGVLEHTFSSIRFSKTFTDELAKEIGQISKLNFELAKICSEATDIVNSGWDSRQASYDRISQKQSDATLGYERVYDKEKGEIYRAPLDFFDSYHGDRYQPVTDDQYLLPIDGYLEWK